MALSEVVEELIAPLVLSGEGRVLAETLRGAAELADTDDATPAGRLRAQQTVIELLDRWSELAGSRELPRIGRLTGEPARAVALALGYPSEELDGLDLPYGFDRIEALRLKRYRRRAKLPVQPGLQALLDDARSAVAEFSSDEGNEDD